MRERKVRRCSPTRPSTARELISERPTLRRRQKMAQISGHFWPPFLADFGRRFWPSFLSALSGQFWTYYYFFFYLFFFGRTFSYFFSWISSWTFLAANSGHFPGSVFFPASNFVFTRSESDEDFFCAGGSEFNLDLMGRIYRTSL